MPFKSEKQRRLMWAKHPSIARRWAAEEKVKKSAWDVVTKMGPDPSEVHVMGSTPKRKRKLKKVT